MLCDRFLSFLWSISIRMRISLSVILLKKSFNLSCVYKPIHLIKKNGRNEKKLRKIKIRLNFIYYFCLLFQTNFIY